MLVEVTEMRFCRWEIRGDCESLDYTCCLSLFRFLCVDVSSPIGEVSGQGIWLSRREEPVRPASRREARRCTYSSYTNSDHRYSLLELIYPGFLVAICAQVYILRISIDSVCWFCLHFFVCCPLSIDQAMIHEIVNLRPFHL